MSIINIIILYNPYYQKNVIEQHLKILKENGIVAFGKIKSIMRDYEHPNEIVLNELYETISQENPMQLFLTDYSSIYVANVIAVKEERTIFVKTPQYYDSMDVEKWFIFDDLRLIVEDDFELVRDKVLANFKATNFNNRTYAVYGNNYVYPMQVTMKEEINYFEKEDKGFKYYTNIFKSDLELQTKQNLINFTFGKDIFYDFAPNTQDNIIASEIEYMQNKHNPLYDYSSLIVKYSKAVELELHRFMKALFKKLIDSDNRLGSLTYSVQGRDYQLDDIQEYKANYGTYKFLLKKYEIKDAINMQLFDSQLRFFIIVIIPKFITTMQNIRNESVHGGTTTFKEATIIRNSILGIGQSSFLGELIINANF